MLEGLLARAKSEEKRAELEAQLAVPPKPVALDYLWKAFIALGNRRQSNGFGPARISWLEFDAYQRMTGMRFAPWEIDMLTDLDDLALTDWGKVKDEGEDQQR